MKEATVSESKEHILGKELAKDFLRKEGFHEVDIHEEYHFKYNNWKKRIDVVGFKYENDYDAGIRKVKESIAIEVGNVSKKDLSKLELFFDKVYHFSKINDIKVDEMYELLIRLNREIKILKEEKEELLEKIEELYENPKDEIFDPDVHLGVV